MAKDSTTPWAVVGVSGQQFKVAEGDVLKLDRLDRAVGGRAFNLGPVLLMVSGDKVEIGQPVVEGAQVKAKVIEHKQDKKISILRFEAKSRRRRRKGHRQPVSVVRIEKITAK